MKDKENIPSKMNYRDFINFMRRYERESKRRTIREHKNVYKYNSVFKKDKKNEF